ncbi:MAG: FecR domain-containing protein [Bacteroidota bacterium]
MNATDPNQPRADFDALLGRVDADEAEALRRVWDLMGPDDPVPGPAPDATEAALQRFQQAAQTPPPGPSHVSDRQPKRSRRQRAGRGLWVAGALTVVLLAVGLGWRTNEVYRAPLGETLSATLPDGSTVELNSGTAMQYTQRLFGARTVQLAGEAFFDVISDSQPFVVETFNAEVRVLGTQFNVRARADQGTTVALTEGRVALTAEGDADSAITMAPGETYRIGRARSGDAVAPEPYVQPIDDAVAWRRGDLVFKGMPVGAMLDEMERRFDVEIEAPTTVRQRDLTFVVRRPANAEAALRDLATALSLQYQPTATGFALLNN